MDAGAAGLDACRRRTILDGVAQADPPPGNPAAGYSGWDKYLNESYLFARPTDHASTARFAGLGQSWSADGHTCSMPQHARGLYISLDNQWAVPHTAKLDTARRFPSFAGLSLSTYGFDDQSEIFGLGWPFVVGSWRRYATELQALHEAGVGVLKVDGGDTDCKVTKLARVHAPNLWVEHGFCGPDCPLNGPLNGSGAGRWPTSMAVRAAATLNCSDAFRSYDMVKSLSVVEVLDRQSKLYSVASGFPRAKPDGETPLRLIGGSGEHMVTVRFNRVMHKCEPR